MNTTARFSLFVLTGISAVAGPTVRYDLSFPNAVHHEAEVKATFRGIEGNSLEIFMSRSSPGRYALHEFAKNVSNFQATNLNGHPLPVDHDTPYSWKVNAADGTVVCSYTLYGDRVDGTYAAIDLTHAHLNLPATLVWGAGFEHAPATLNFQVPEHSNWKPATQLVPNADGTFSAPDLEWMMDSPVELSNIPLREWQMDGETFRLALHHNGSEAEAIAFEDMCKRVVAEEKAIFGRLAPYDHGTYTFLVDFLPYANGDGMEHRDSSVITGALTLHDAAPSAIGIISHEFFHSWNVRRMRPKSLEPFDFERTNMSRELWFAEGFTNYYGELVLRRCNLMSFDDFLADMGQAVDAVLTDPGRKVRSAAGMSAEAPFVDAARSIDPTDTVNDFISYYTYGQALAFGIDLAIRARYPGKSLDDWMQTVWREHPDIEKPYGMQDLEKALAETTGDAAFAHDIFLNHITGCQPLDYARLAAPAGISLTLANPGKAWLGTTRLMDSASGLDVDAPTLRGSPAYLAGIDTGDKLEQCAGQPLRDPVSLESCLAAHKPGETVAFKVKGRAGIRTVNVKLQQDPHVTFVSFAASGQPLTSEIKAFRDLWLKSKTVSFTY